VIDLKFGKLPARTDARDLKLAKYAVEPPPLPDGPLGHDQLFAGEWGMLGNDSVGDCVWAGSAHETMLWNLEAGLTVVFTPDSVLSDYSAATGYQPGQPSTDRGTDMHDAMNYRRTTGIVDGTGLRHKIGGYVALDPGDLDQLKRSIWWFSAVSIGIEVPTTAMDQFNQNQPWSVVAGAQIEGGHYIPGVRWDPTQNMFVIVTWGREQLVTPEFLATYCDEAFAALSPEMLTGGKTLDGFDVDQLTADLAAL
jgi:hypothetical protein